MKYNQEIIQARPHSILLIFSRYHRLCIRSIVIALSLISVIISGCSRYVENSSHKHPKDKDWFFWSVDWKPSGDQIIVGGSNDTFFKLLSSRSNKLIKTYSSIGTITKTKWHPTENKLAISVQDGKSYPFIFNVDKEQSIRLDSISIHGARAIGWNYSGDILAIGDYEGNLTFYDKYGNFKRKIHTNQKAIIGLDWHPSDNVIIAVGERITTYNYDLGTLNNINDRSEEVEVLMLCVDWHPSGDFFVTGDYGDFEYNYPPLLQFWTYDGIIIKSIVESKAEIRNIKWSNDGDLLATASEKIRLWDKKGNLIAENSSKNLLWGIDWNKNSDKIVATDEDRNILFWDRELKMLSKIEF